jgi:undecaprenyl-phosphate 4-deoxy-4-formamido-L-arabinose transferase
MDVLNSTDSRYEIVFVDDGSPDGSWAKLVDVQQTWPDRIVAVQLMRNFGQHNAIMCGFRHSSGALIVTIDDDLQNPPEEIPKLIEALHSRDLDVVYGISDVKQHHVFRNLGSALVNVFFRQLFRSSITVGPFRAMRREVLESIFTYSLNFTYIDGLLAWNTQRIGQVPVRHDCRASGRSGYSITKLLTLALNLFTNFSLLPLQFVTLLGFFAAGGGLLLGTYYVVQYLLGNIAVPGYASIIVAVLLLGGIQLLSLGIIGEYLGRVHLNINRKPQYTVRTVLARCEQSDLSGADSPEFDRTPAALVCGNSG